MGSSFAAHPLNSRKKAMGEIDDIREAEEPEDCHSTLFEGDEDERLPAEVEEGPTEYKRKMVQPTPERFTKLVSQLKWRLGEGQGEAIYEIGVDDDGTVRGLSETDLAESIAT